MKSKSTHKICAFFLLTQNKNLSVDRTNLKNYQQSLNFKTKRKFISYFCKQYSIFLDVKVISIFVIKEIKAKELISEMDKGRRAPALLIQKMPHIIPHSDRVVLFRRYVSSDKSGVGVFQDQASGRSTLVTIHR